MIGVASGWKARHEVEAGQLVAIPLLRAKLRRRWVANTLKGRPLSLAERTFLGLCKEAGRRVQVVE